MIHEYVLNALTRAYGQPRRAEPTVWWVVENGTHGRHPVHVCLNQEEQAQDSAHLLIFDPACTKSGGVIEHIASSVQEADRMIASLERLVASNGCRSRPDAGGMRAGSDE
jgi:hypothetical protein